jgi:hypothetical protein
MNSKKYLDFLKRVVKKLSPENDYYLVVDNFNTHKSKIVKDYANTIPNLFLKYMIPYSGIYFIY